MVVGFGNDSYKTKNNICFQIFFCKIYEQIIIESFVFGY